MTEESSHHPSAQLLEFMSRAVSEKLEMLNMSLTGPQYFECPKCKGRVTVLLIGPKKHLRATCATYFCLRVME
jgi:hypothetical protein